MQASVSANSGMGYAYPVNIQRKASHRWPDTSGILRCSARAMRSRHAQVLWFTAASRMRPPASRWKRFLSLVVRDDP
jgi:hypothetical protein